MPLEKEGNQAAQDGDEDQEARHTKGIQMQRLYVRRDRNFVSLDQVRCPSCGKTAKHRRKKHLPTCYGSHTTARPRGYY